MVDMRPEADAVCDLLNAFCGPTVKAVAVAAPRTTAEAAKTAVENFIFLSEESNA